MFNEDLIECPQCNEVAVVVSSNFKATINCRCGILEVDTMIEEDRLFPVYQQVFGTFAMNRSDDEPMKRLGSLSSLKYKRGGK